LNQDLAAQGERGTGGGAGSAGGEPSGGGLPEFVEIDAPGVNPTGVWLWGVLRDTRNLLAALSGPGEAGCGARCVGGGPARRCIAGALALGDSWTGIRVCGFCVHAQSQWRPGQGTVRARRRCGAPATAELRRRGIGVRCLGTGVGHGLRQLMQKEKGAGL